MSPDSPHAPHAPAGRADEARMLRERVGDPGPSLVLVTGRRGAGKSTLLRSALAGRDAVWYDAAPLPDPDHRGLLARRLPLPSGVPGGGDGPPGWDELFSALSRHLDERRRRTVLVLDGWSRMAGASSRLEGALEAFWRRVRKRGLPLHLVLAAEPGEATRALRDPEGPFDDWIEEDLHLGPLPYRAVTGRAPPSWGPRERLLLHAVFGGWPEVVRHLDRLDDVPTIEEAVVSRVLAPEAPLLHWGTEVLERELQSSGRYASLLRGMAGGARSWGGLTAACPAFETGSQMAPYLNRLREMELVEVERSLDAGPRTRRRRYVLTDPFVRFWFAFVLPHRTDLELGRAREVWRTSVRPELERHAARTFSGVCRAYMRDHADERLPARPREVGGLWGSGYDLGVSGTLRNGAIFYGKACWGPGAAEVERGREVDREFRETRYGFGREARHRIVFLDVEPEPELARWAGRDALAHVVDPAALVGEVP